MSFERVFLKRRVLSMIQVTLYSAWLFLFTVKFLCLHPSPSNSLLQSHLHEFTPSRCHYVSRDLFTSLYHTKERTKKTKNISLEKWSFSFEGARSYFARGFLNCCLSCFRSHFPSHCGLTVFSSPHFCPYSISLPSPSYSLSSTSADFRTYWLCRVSSPFPVSSLSSLFPSYFPSCGLYRFRPPRRPPAAATILCNSELLYCLCTLLVKVAPTANLEKVPRAHEGNRSDSLFSLSRATIFVGGGGFHFPRFFSSLQEISLLKKAIRKEARVHFDYSSPMLPEPHFTTAQERNLFFVPFSWVEPLPCQGVVDASLLKRTSFHLSLFSRVPKGRTLAGIEKRKQAVLAYFSSLLGVTTKTSSTRTKEALESSGEKSVKQGRQFVRVVHRCLLSSEGYEKFSSTTKERSPIRCFRASFCAAPQHGNAARKKDLFFTTGMSEQNYKNQNNTSGVAVTSPAFVLLDLIKIFGRLAEPSSVGSVIASPVSSPAGVAADVLAVYDRLLRPLSPDRTLPKEDAAAAESGVSSTGGAGAAIAGAAGPVEQRLARITGAAAPPTAAGPTPPTTLAEGQARVAASVEAWLDRERARWRHSTYESLLAQGSKRAFMGKGGCPKRRKWERVFVVPEQQQQQERRLHVGEKELVRDRVLGTGLTRQAFEVQLLRLPFSWPLLPNTGALPATVPYQPAALEEFLAVCSSARGRSATAATTAKNVEGGRCRIPHYESVNAVLRRSLIHKDALDCVWRAFTTLFHGPFGEVLPATEKSAETRLLPAALLQYQKSICQTRHLYKGDVLRCIWQWAPTDGFVDWNSFTFFLDESPADGIDKLGD